MPTRITILFLVFISGCANPKSIWTDLEGLDAKEDIIVLAKNECNYADKLELICELESSAAVLSGSFVVEHNHSLAIKNEQEARKIRKQLMECVIKFNVIPPQEQCQAHNLLK